MTYDNQDPYSQYDPSGLTPQELLARIESVKTRIASTVTQLGVAESQIAQSAEQILLRVEKNGIISAINLSPEEITIAASKINLVGAVTVLSDITGELGTIIAGDLYGVNIYSGNILIDTNARIGGQLDLGINIGINDFKINFGDVADFTVWMGNSNEYHIDYNAFKHHFNGTVDFSGASVEGLNVTVSFG